MRKGHNILKAVSFISRLLLIFLYFCAAAQVMAGIWGERFPAITVLYVGVLDDLRPERGNPFLGIFSSYPAGSLYRDPLGSLFLYSLPEKTDLETGTLCLRAAGRLAAAGKRNQQQKRLFPDRKGRFLGKGSVLY